jgi:NAD(P)-dependent dehydrogenase (short-subunit alcohol dehydrogenase family)
VPRHEIRSRAQKRSAIVNTAHPGIIGYADAAVYTASKHAIVGLRRLRDSVPGAGRELPAAWRDTQRDVRALVDRVIWWRGRDGPGDSDAAPEPEEQAAAGVPAADAAAYMTGANVVVDGDLSVP